MDELQKEQKISLSTRVTISDWSHRKESMHSLKNWHVAGKKSTMSIGKNGMNGQKQIIGDYPLLVDLETVSRCNLKCPMCPTVTDEFVDSA